MSDNGTAGASARREYERRRGNDEKRLRERWGRLGGVAVALSDEKKSTTAWRTGAAGEERVGRLLDEARSPRVAVLHDRRIPGSRANIDHLVVTPGGVWVVDSKKYKGQVERRIFGGILRPREERLFVGNRDKTALVDGMRKQMDHVERAVSDVPVVGVLCFVGSEWGLFAKPFTIGEVNVVWPSKFRTWLDGGGDVDVARTAAALAARFRSS